MGIPLNNEVQPRQLALHLRTGTAPPHYELEALKNGKKFKKIKKNEITPNEHTVIVLETS